MTKSSPSQSIAATILIVLLLAVVNFIAGRLGLMLAVGPGYASAVFPPAGIALAALLLFGNRVWPGVFLGSWALSTPEFTNAYVPLSIATGSTLQAIVGASLIRRTVGFPISLDDERSIARFFLLGGPVACLIASTWGITTLCLTDHIKEDVAYNALAWWVGDSIGVMIFAPLLLVAFGHPREVWRPRWLSVGLPVAMSFGVVVGLFYYARTNAELDQRLEFNRLADNVQSEIVGEVSSYLETLHSIAGLYRSSEEVTREEFRLFVERTFPRQPGIKALGWVPRILAHQQEDFEQAARQDAPMASNPQKRAGLEAFKIHRWHGGGPDGVWKPYHGSIAEELFPVYFVEPYAGNEAALGIDLASHPERQFALRGAREFDAPVATGPIKLVQEPARLPAILLIVPVHAVGKPRETPKQRAKHLQGFASAVVRVRDLIETSCSPADLNMIELTIVDDAIAKPDPELLYRSPNQKPQPSNNGNQVELSHHDTISVGGRRWNISITPSEAFLKASRTRQLWSELAIGFLFTVAVGGSTLLVTGRSRQVEMLVEQRTHELRLNRFAIDHAADSIFWINDEGRFTDVNRMACIKTGYTLEELTSMSVWDVDPTFPRDAWTAHRQELHQAGSLVFESLMQTKDGQMCPVEISTGYIDFFGKSYECAIVRDISERKEVENKLKADEDLLRKLLDIQERERRTVAYEIHDGFVQYAIGAQMQAETLRPEDDDLNDANGNSGRLDKVLSLLRKAIDEGRNMISDLRPMVIDESGVVYAIEHLLADVAKQGLTVTFNHDVQFDRLEPMLESAIFRIVQEALNNVKHHSQAKHAVVKLTQEDSRLQVSVQDQGIGFDFDKIPSDRFGLRGIQERATLFGGHANVDSSPGNGTLVRVELPVTPVEADSDSV